MKLLCTEYKEKQIVGDFARCWGLFGTHDYYCPVEWIFIRGTVSTTSDEDTPLN